MKLPIFILALLIAVSVAFMPQDPTKPAAKTAPTEHATIVSLSEMQYVTRQGETRVIPARNVVEIRLFEDAGEGLRLELLYDNGDYSLIDAQALHILRNGPSTREVKLVRAQRASMRFPTLP